MHVSADKPVQVDTQKQLKLNLSPQRIIFALGVGVFVLALVHAGIQVFDYLVSPQFDGWKKLDSLFNFAHESNFPTWYTSFLLTLTSMAVGLITVIVARSTTRTYLFHWAFLTFVFLGLSMEEQIQIHELVSEKLEDQFELGGIFAWTWVIPGLILVAILVLLYLKFSFSLPRSIRTLLAVAAIMYVGSAIGLEMVSASYSENSDPRFAIVWTLVFLEETLEMSAIVLFIYAFLDYLRLQVDQITVNLVSQQFPQDVRQSATTPGSGKVQQAGNQPVPSTDD